MKQGYKQTDIGLIPEDWNAVPIGEFLEFKNGLNKGKEFFGYGTPIVNYTDTYKKRALKRKDIEGRVSLSKEEIRRFEARQYDVFFTRTSETPDEVGLSSVLLDEIDDCVFSGFILRGRPKNNLLDPLYCKYCFSTKEVRRSIITGCTYTTRALTNGKQLSSIKILVPSLAEQKRIAEALSDVDELIASLEKLIEKKKALKQGVMQELLTGKRRLPGFTGEWKEQPLDKYGEFIRGVSFDPNVDLALFDNGAACKLLRANNIVDNDLDIHEVLFVSSRCVSPKQKLQKGDIVIAMSSGSTIAIGKNAQYLYDFDDYCVGAFCAVFRSEISNYISYILQSNMFRKQLSELLEGTSINNLNGAILGKMTFPFSDNNDERKAVCSVLDNIAKEINLMKAQQNKYKKIKSGMMNELLTGRIRLV